MSEITTDTKRTTIASYKVPVQYYARDVIKGASIQERLIETDAEIAMLCRTSPSHTAFGPQLLKGSSGDDLSAITPIARRFAELVIVDDKIRDSIVADDMACLDLFFSKPVQEDVERFLSTWGVVKNLIKAAEENQAATEEQDPGRKSRY